MKLLVLVAALLLAGCQEKKSETNVAEKSENEVLIGAVFAMTGPIASYGQESVNGIRMALDEVNQTPINGRQLKVLVEDNKGEPVESANAVRKLIDINKVDIIIGSVASSNTLASAPIAQAAKIPLLTPASTNEKVTMTGDYIFRSCFTDNFQGVVMAKFAYETLSKRKAAIIVDNSSDYSKGLQSVFKAEFTRLGGAVIEDNYTYTQKDTDFRSLLRKVKAASPDVVFLPGYYSEVGLILKQAREMGLEMPFLGGDGWDSPKLQELAGPKGIKGNYISSHFSPDDVDPRVQKFVKDYMTRFNEKPGAMAALGYDAILVLADALRRSGSSDSASLQKALASTVGFEGVTGAITIDANRNAQKSAVVLETTATGNIFKQKVNP